MRLKSYNAATMAEAMRMVREELGDDAIIVSTQRASDGQGVRITAALEDPSDEDDIDRAITGRNTTPFAEKVREAVKKLDEEHPELTISEITSNVKYIEESYWASLEALGLEAGLVVGRQRGIGPDPVHGTGRDAMDAGTDLLQPGQQGLRAEVGKGVAALKVHQVRHRGAVTGGITRHFNARGARNTDNAKHEHHDQNRRRHRRHASGGPFGFRGAGLHHPFRQSRRDNGRA